MSNLDRVIPFPHLLEVDQIDVAAPPERAHALLRHMDLRRSSVVRALIFMRGLPERLRGQTPANDPLRFDELARRAGFRILADDATTFAVATEGASGLGPHGELTFGWEVRCSPLGERAARVMVELRVATDDTAAWRRFQRAFRLVGPVSRLARRHVLALVADDLGVPKGSSMSGPVPETV